MARLRKRVLLDRFLTSISLSGWQWFVQAYTHPFFISIWSGDQLLSLRLYIWNMTPGGPRGVRPEGEFRIQITGVSRPLLATPGTQDILLGWEEDIGVFAAFDVERHRTYGSSPSIQVYLSTLQEAQRLGIAFQTRGNREIVVAFAPDQLINYLSRQGELHGLGQSPNEERVLFEALEEEPLNIEGFEEIPRVRQDAISSVHRWVRERTFRERVLRAYQHRCSVCHLQLQIVQAAHIVPVHIQGSSDMTSNGLALCPSHHSAYDGGLLGVAPNYHIVVNQTKLNELRSQRLNGGEESILGRVCNTIIVPSQLPDRPSPEYLRRGLEIRGWPPSFNWSSHAPQP